MNHIRKLDRSVIPEKTTLDGVVPLLRSHGRIPTNYYFTYTSNAEKVLWWILECGDSLEKNSCSLKSKGEIDSLKYTFVHIGYVNEHFSRPEVALFVSRTQTDPGMLIFIFDMNSEKLQTEPKRIVNKFDGYTISTVAPT